MKEAAIADSPAAPAARASTVTRTPISGTRGASTRLLDVRPPSSGLPARGHDVRSSQSWMRSWRKRPAPCCTLLVYAAAWRVPNALSRAQNLTGNEDFFLSFFFFLAPHQTPDPLNPNLWPLIVCPSVPPSPYLIVHWPFWAFFVWEYPCPTKQMAIVSFTQENKAI